MSLQKLVHEALVVNAIFIVGWLVCESIESNNLLETEISQIFHNFACGNSNLELDILIEITYRKL